MRSDEHAPRQSEPTPSADQRTQRVKYEKRGRIAYITLNRPELLNAMDLRMQVELQRVWDDFERDDDIWLGVLTGEGTRAFSVGQDLKELAGLNRGGEPPTSFGSQG